jgi:hypothetical protein
MWRRASFPLMPKRHTPFIGGNPKAYVITNFKFQGMMSFVGVTLLTGLGSQYILMNLLHLLFCLYHNVGVKGNSLT